MYSTQRGFPLELGNYAWAQENWDDGAVRPRKKFDSIFSRLDTIHECDEQIDRQTDTGRRLVPRLCIASHGNNIWPASSIIILIKYTDVIAVLFSQCDEIVLCAIWQSSQYRVFWMMNSSSSSFLACNSRLRRAICQPHPLQRPVLGHIHCLIQAVWDYESSDSAVWCSAMWYVGVLMVSSSPLEGELTGSSWHLCYRPYAQCFQKGSRDVIGLLQWWITCRQMSVSCVRVCSCLSLQVMSRDVGSSLPEAATLAFHEALQVITHPWNNFHSRQLCPSPCYRGLRKLQCILGTSSL